MGKFRIKIKRDFFSESFVVLRYSTNGMFWKNVKDYQYDDFFKTCYMSTKTIYIEDVEEMIKKFNTLDKIKIYEAEQKDKVIKRNKEISVDKKIYKKYQIYVYKKFG